MGCCCLPAHYYGGRVPCEHHGLLADGLHTGSRERTLLDELEQLIQPGHVGWGRWDAGHCPLTGAHRPHWNRMRLSERQFVRTFDARALCPRHGPKRLEAALCAGAVCAAQASTALAAWLRTALQIKKREHCEN